MSLQPTKIIGAVLAVAVVAFAIDFVSNQIFAKQELKVPGYVVEVTEPVAEVAPAGPAPEASTTAAAAPAVETPPAAEAAPAEVTAAPTAAEPAPTADASAPAAVAAAPAAAPAVADGGSIADRLKAADAAAGGKSAKVCTACHSFADSGDNKVGPGLWEVVNRKPGTHPGFKYSPAMVTFGESHVWDYATLDIYLTNPKTEVPGNKMAFAGVKKPEDRASIIAYLRSLSASPAPLP